MATGRLLLRLVAHGSRVQGWFSDFFFPKMDRRSFSLQSLRNPLQGIDFSVCRCKYHAVVYLSGRVYVMFAFPLAPYRVMFKFLFSMKGALVLPSTYF